AGFEEAAGLRIEHVKHITRMIDQLHGIATLAEARGMHRAVLMEDMDALQAAADLVLSSGAATAVAAHAGREGFDATALEIGRGIASFATLREALGAGRTPTPDQLAHSPGSVHPEMTVAEWARVPAAARRRVRVFELVPGEKLFE